MLASRDIGADPVHRSLALTGVEIGLPPAQPLNQLPLRAAMGLGERTGTAFGAEFKAAFDALRGEDAGTLVRLAEDPERPFLDRYAAGRLLGLIGDPRIDPEAPAMITVEGGRYHIGLNSEEVDAVTDRFRPHGVVREWIEKETPRHAVELGTFRIAKYPVTNGEWARFMKDAGQEVAPLGWPFGVLPAGLDNLPVYTVAPEWADRYAAWLSERTGRQFRLPTEAEWEVAAAGEEGRVFPWGDDISPDCANTVESGILSATPVGIFPRGATPEGILDLAGNVEEYVADDYVAYPGGPHIEDNLNQDTSRYRVARGGSFTRYIDLARSRRRHGWFKTELYAMGFRLAEVPR